MSVPRPTWFAVSPTGHTAFPCAVCGQAIELGPRADHHPGVCPHCQTESAFLDWKGRTVQIVPHLAPSVLTAFVRWAQDQLDELEYVELLCSLEEIADALNAVAVSS